MLFSCQKKVVDFFTNDKHTDQIFYRLSKLWGNNWRWQCGLVRNMRQTLISFLGSDLGGGTVAVTPDEVCDSVCAEGVEVLLSLNTIRLHGCKKNFFWKVVAIGHGPCHLDLLVPSNSISVNFLTNLCLCIEYREWLFLCSWFNHLVFEHYQDWQQRCTILINKIVRVREPIKYYNAD